MTTIMRLSKDAFTPGELAIIKILATGDRVSSDHLAELLGCSGAYMRARLSTLRKKLRRIAPEIRINPYVDSFSNGYQLLRVQPLMIELV